MGLGCRGLADASGGLGKTPLIGHRYATLLRSGGYAAPDANICYNSFVRGKIVRRAVNGKCASSDWESEGSSTEDPV